MLPRRWRVFSDPEDGARGEPFHLRADQGGGAGSSSGIFLHDDARARLPGRARPGDGFHRSRCIIISRAARSRRSSTTRRPTRISSSSRRRPPRRAAAAAPCTRRPRRCWPRPLSSIGVSLGAVFFGAMTYIGNGPNFMVKTIAERRRRALPDLLRLHLQIQPAGPAADPGTERLAVSLGRLLERVATSPGLSWKRGKMKARNPRPTNAAAPDAPRCPRQFRGSRLFLPDSRTPQNSGTGISRPRAS